MRQLWTVGRFALRDMLRSWILWVMAAVLVIAIPVVAEVLRRSALWRSAASTQAVPLSSADQATYVDLGVVLSVYAITLLCGGVITTNVALERTSKVSILVFRLVRPAVLVWGKLLALATIVVGLIVLLGVEVAVLGTSGTLSLGTVARILGLQSLGWAQILVGVLYAVLGVILYTTCYAMVGLMVNEAGQLQFAQLPVTMVLIVSFCLVVATMSSPDGVLAHVLAYIPFTSPFLEAGRIINHTASVEERAISLVLLAVAVAAATRAMSRLVHARTPVTARNRPRPTLAHLQPATHTHE